MSQKLTVIIATLDEGAPYKKTVESCLSQIGVDIEVVVFVKDNLHSLKNPSVSMQSINGVRITTIRGHDLGIADAWNTAIRYSTGDHLCFLGTGDFFYSNTSVRDIFSLAAKLNKINCVFFGEQLVRMTDIYFIPWSKNKYFDPISLKNGMVIPHASSFWPRELWVNRIFDASFKISLDYEFALRVMGVVDFFKLDVIVAVIEPGGLSNSPKKMLQVIAEDIKARKINGLPPNKYSILNIKRTLRWILGRFA